MSARAHCSTHAAAVLAAGLIAGCSGSRAADSVRTRAEAADRRARAEVVFAQAALLKPDGSGMPEALPLAPIIVEQSSSAESIGALPHRTVYAGEMTAELHGTPYRQWVYVWAYPLAKHWCWLRVTLDSLGYPMIWEILTDAGPPVEVYGAQSLEDRAVRQFGPPPEGSFALAPPQKANGVRFVRLLNDGPVAMGPMVYVDAAHHVPTVICRCMPAQVLAVDETATYALAPAETLPGPRVAPSAESAFLPAESVRGRAWATTVADPQFLERNLRLPNDF